jgi:hypothetical protein
MKRFKTVVRYPVKKLTEEENVQLVKLITEEAIKIDAIKARNSEIYNSIIIRNSK